MSHLGIAYSLPLFANEGDIITIVEMGPTRAIQKNTYYYENNAWVFLEVLGVLGTGSAHLTNNPTNNPASASNANQMAYNPILAGQIIFNTNSTYGTTAFGHLGSGLNSWANKTPGVALLRGLDNSKEVQESIKEYKSEADLLRKNNALKKSNFIYKSTPFEKTHDFSPTFFVYHLDPVSLGAPTRQDIFHNFCNISATNELHCSLGSFLHMCCVSAIGLSVILGTEKIYSPGPIEGFLNNHLYPLISREQLEELGRLNNNIYTNINSIRSVFLITQNMMLAIIDDSLDFDRLFASTFLHMLESEAVDERELKKSLLKINKESLDVIQDYYANKLLGKKTDALVLADLMYQKIEKTISVQKIRNEING